MAIIYNDANNAKNTTISTINYGSTEINTVTYNGTVVFSKLVPYTFPNSDLNTKMTSRTSYGINVYHDYANNASYHGWKAFDNDKSTGFVGSYADNGRAIAIVFPFDIQVQSITITNVSAALSGSGTIGGLKKGYIYMSPSVLNDTDSNSAVFASNYSIIYATLNRTNPNTASGATSHTNSDYASTNIRSICIYGTSWGSTGASKWHEIGEVSIKFKAKSSDLAAAGLL